MIPEFRKVEALLALGRNDEAAALVGSLPAREQPSVEYLRLRGRALRAAGRVFDAEVSFREAIALQPNDPALLADLATTLVGQKRLKEALVYAREVVSIRPDVAAFQALLGFVADALDLADEAGRALRMARELAPADPEAQTVYGYHALRNGDLASAEVAFRDALSADPRRTEALRGLARVALARGDVSGARARWLEALSADPRITDRRLDRVIWIGHPALRPARTLMRVPMGVSVGLFVCGVALLIAKHGETGAQVGALALFALAAVGPLSRRAIVGGLGE